MGESVTERYQNWARFNYRRYEGIVDVGGIRDIAKYIRNWQQLSTEHNKASQAKL
jgi:hypothetical protein